MTRRQSNNQWSGGSPRPKKFRVQKSTGKFLASIFLRSRRLIISQRAKLSTRSITHLCWSGATEGHFEGKTPRAGHHGCLVLAQYPGSLGACNSEETGLPGLPMSRSPTPFPDMAPSDYHLFPGLKKQLKGRHFSSEGEIIAAAETWLDGQLSDFLLSGFRMLEQRTKKCIEFRAEYFE